LLATPAAFGWLSLHGPTALGSWLAALRPPLLASRRTRRIVAEAASLIGSEFPRWCYLLRGSDLGARFTHRLLRTEGPAAPQILLAHDDRIGNLRGAREHARLHLEGSQRPPDPGCDERRRNAGVHSKATTVADLDSTVDEDGLAKEGRVLPF
jgi:hypothetical protein